MRQTIMRMQLALMFILSTVGFVSAQSEAEHPWVYKDQNVASYIDNSDFYSKITLFYQDGKIWLTWEFEGPIAIKSYLEASTNGGHETILNVPSWGNCHQMGCLIMTQENRTWISFSITNEALDAIAKDEIIKFRYYLENNVRKYWTQNLIGSRDAITQFRQAHSIQ